jgi:glucokinase
MPDQYVLAGDVGGTNLRIAAVSNVGSVLCQISEPTPKTGAAADVVAAVNRLAERCIAESGVDERPLSFGLALAALVSVREGRVLSSPNLPELNGLLLAGAVSDSLRLNVVLENDATAAAIGEDWLGSSKGVKNSVFVTLGTGVGGGLILDGRVYRGVDGTAGEVGHICVEPEGYPCGCGSHGCVEQYSSATAVVRMAGELLRQDASSMLHQNPHFTSKDVYGAAAAGDRVSLETFRRMGRYLGIALAGLVDVLNPELIVIGGGAAAGWDYFIEHARSEVRARAFPHPAMRVQLVRASLGEAAGILGAARVALDSLTEPVHLSAT